MSIVFYGGIIVTFVAVWGVIMVVGFMFGGMSPDTPVDRTSNWVTGKTESAETPLDPANPAPSPE
jgi:hypothetical protein